MIDTIDAPLFDTERLDELRMVLGDAQTAQLVAAFASELETRPALVRQMIERGDHAGVRGAAHLFRGAALSIGAVRVSDMAQALEHADRDTLDDSADRFLQSAADTMAALLRLAV